MSPSWRSARALADWLRQQPRTTVAILIWAVFALLMIAGGVGRVADHRPFGSWVPFAASAGVAGFYAYWLAGRWTKHRTRGDKL